MLPVILCGLAFNAELQDNEEIVLFFHYPAVGQKYISAVYSGGSVYLPLTELFTLLYVHYEKGGLKNEIRGTWVDAEIKWHINFNDLKAKIGKREINFTKSDFRKGKTELYLSPGLFNRLFGLHFQIHMNSLSVKLECDETLPAETRQKRKRLHLRLERQLSENRYYPVLYPRERKYGDIGMVDYKIGFCTGNKFASLNYNVRGGMEILGGSLQGDISGRLSGAGANFRAGNVNWHYALKKNPFLTSIELGNISGAGLLKRPFAGISFTNEPLVPRRFYDTHCIEGNTVPGSEVELYINNRLGYFTKADELGHYSFYFPLTYGNVRTRLKIYKPSGEIVTEGKHIEIPFSFLPPGILSYKIEGGVLSNEYFNIDYQNYFFNGYAALGITKKITARFGAEYLRSSKPLLYSSLSGRLLENYLLNIDLAPGAFYRIAARVRYLSGSSIKLTFTDYNGYNLYNPMHANQSCYAGVYLPFNLSGIKSGIRLIYDHALSLNSSGLNCLAGYSARIDRLHLRLDYRIKLINNSQSTFQYNGLMASVNYTFPRLLRFPSLLRGLFASFETEYDVSTGNATNAGIQVSQTVLRRGRLRINVHYDITACNLFFGGGMNFNLPSFRSDTRYNNIHGASVIRQDFHGSVSYDTESRKLLASGRRQVGRAAVSVIFFNDSDGNGSRDQGEEIIPAAAIRLDQSASMELCSDSVLRISHLTGYKTYYAEVIREALPDPLLAPQNNIFSFVADPNRYTHIDIPLYHTGVIEGNIISGDREDYKDIGELRLVIKKTDSDLKKSVEIFSDGSFYCMDLLPGCYKLEVDPVQLEFLGAKSIPRRRAFEIKRVEGGDFLENLNFELIDNNHF